MLKDVQEYFKGWKYPRHMPHTRRSYVKAEIQMVTKGKWGCDSHGAQDGPSEIHLVIPQTLMGCPGLSRLRAEAKLQTALRAAVGDTGQEVR